MDRLCSPDELSRAISRINSAFEGRESLSLGARLALGMHILDSALGQLSAAPRSEVAQMLDERLMEHIANPPPIPITSPSPVPARRRRAKAA